LYASIYQASPIGNAYRGELGATDAGAIQQRVAEVMLGWRAAEDGVPQASPTDLAQVNALAAAAAAGARTDPPPEPAGAQLTNTDTAQDRKRRAAIEVDRQRRALRHARGRVSVTLYSTSWCGFCRTARAYLNEQGIAFEEHDIDADAAAKASILRLNPRGSVPTIDIDGEVLVGWSSRRFDSMLERAVRERARL
jgi:glutaredoxin